MSEVAEADNVSGDDPSPQFTVKEDTVPSGSVAEKDIVTDWLMVAELGVGLLRVKIGGRSIIVSDVV